MDQLQVQALAALLHRALNSVLIRDHSRNQHIHVDTYRENLRRSWTAHDTDLNLTTRYKPLVEDAALKRDLLQTVTAELSPHIHEDTIQTAAIAVVGGPAPGFTLEDLVRHILNIAIVRGPLYTADAFYRCVENPTATYQLFGLLTGARVDQELQISPGIKLVPTPESTSELPSHLPRWPSISPIDLMGRTLIAIDHDISPVFLNPRLTEMDTRSPFTDSAANADYPDFNIERFCEALSLAGNASIVCAANWTHIEPTEIFNVSATSRGGSHSYMPGLVHRMGSVKVTQDDISEALTIYRGMQDLPPRVATKLRVPIDRWIKSKADRSPVDTFIDLGIALESLYLQDTDNTSELSFRLALRAAWYLAEDRAGRRAIMKDLRYVYGRRSKAVHTGDIGSLRDVAARLETGQQLCRQSIVKVIRKGGFPDWNQLVLGEADRCEG